MALAKTNETTALIEVNQRMINLEKTTLILATGVT